MGLNLHAIVFGNIAAVNPPSSGTLKVSTGSTKNPDYSRTPTYASYPVQIQSQPLTSNDLRHLNEMNIQNVQRKAYLFGAIEGVQRVTGQGGDLLVFNGQTWLVTAVLEPFDNAGWTCVGLTMQDGA